MLRRCLSDSDALARARQTGIDELNARLAGNTSSTAPRPTPTERVTPAPPRESTTAATANAASALLTRLANETSLLNALTEVLTRHHAEAQQRLAAAAARLSVAENSTGLLRPGRSAASPLPLPSESADVLAIEYPSDGHGASLDGRTDATSPLPLAHGREVLALTHAPDDVNNALDSAHMAGSLDSTAAAVVRSRSTSPSPRDRTPAAGGALVVRSPAGAQLASRMAAGSLRDLLDYALTDTDFTNVLALLTSVGGNTGAPPASAAAIDAVPEVQLTDVDAMAASCAICLADLGCGAVKSLPCGAARVPHAFHAQCINAWLRLHNSCPTCRASIAEPAADQGRRSTGILP